MPAFDALSPRHRTASLALLGALTLVLAGCGGSSSSPAAGPSPSPSGVGGAQPVASTVVLGKVAGDLHQPNRRVFAHRKKPMLAAVGKAVDSWIDGGFVGGSYPRTSFGAAFTSFTKPAAHDALRAKKLTTNWALGKSIDGVVVKKRTITVDVLAPKGRPAGVTARVHLVFTTSGQVHKRVTVDARLFLSPTAGGGWRIFGYDVSRGAV